ncbi:hypothetical protein [Geoglobus ahangari]
MKLRFAAMMMAAVLILSSPAYAKFGEIGINTVYDSIKQGETDWFSRYISSQTFDVYLVWNNPSSSLTLTLYSPNGDVYGPFRDSSDGAVDGKIALTVENAEQGVWYFKVYGERVGGVQYYSLTVL